MLFASICVFGVLATLAWLLAVAMVWGWGRSDPAGNGLGEVYVLGAFAVTWGLVGILLEIACRGMPVPVGDWMPWPWGPSGMERWSALGLAVGAQVFGFAALFTSSCRGVARAVLKVGAVVLPLPFLVHAAWRGFGWPRFSPLATWGCLWVLVTAVGCCVGGAVVCRWARARTRERARRAPAPADILYPALLVRFAQSVRVLRGADEMLAAGPEVVESAASTVLVDCQRACYQVTFGEGKFTLLARPALSMQELHELLLGMPPFHADPARNAEIRRLVAMQRDVSGLSFVLPRT
ncbi:MAG: hypothetical protein KA020_07370 [Planctomycetes bacterium]|nr:hypothetical protein [Planctomycetota bacterium]MCC7063552.1 hypothetical protein [Planctomycetota bacterium]